MGDRPRAACSGSPLHACDALPHEFDDPLPRGLIHVGELVLGKVEDGYIAPRRLVASVVDLRRESARSGAKVRRPHPKRAPSRRSSCLPTWSGWIARGSARSRSPSQSPTIQSSSVQLGRWRRCLSWTADTTGRAPFFSAGILGALTLHRPACRAWCTLWTGGAVWSTRWCRPPPGPLPGPMLLHGAPRPAHGTTMIHSKCCALEWNHCGTILAIAQANSPTVVLWELATKRTQFLDTGTRDITFLRWAPDALQVRARGWGRRDADDRQGLAAGCGHRPRRAVPVRLLREQPVNLHEQTQGKVNARVVERKRAVCVQQRRQAGVPRGRVVWWGAV